MFRRHGFLGVVGGVADAESSDGWLEWAWFGAALLASFGGAMRRRSSTATKEITKRGRTEMRSLAGAETHSSVAETMNSEPIRKRRTLGVAGIGHQAPIPQAVELGGVVFSSAILGQDPATGELPPEPARQTELIFEHVRALLEQAHGSPDAIVKMTFYVTDEAFRDHVNREWLRMFPDENDRPARHTVRTDVRRGLVQCEFVAVLER
jgi:2-iminobutanoate/2-iminopropanoate deaminase